MDFSPKSTRYVVLVGLTIGNSLDMILNDYWALRHELYMNPVEYQSNQCKYTNKRFHASEDPQEVRDKVFDLILRNIGGFRVRALIIEKANVYDQLQKDEWLYLKMYFYLVRSILQNTNWTENVAGLQFIVDYNKTRRLTEASKSGIKFALAAVNNLLPYGLHHTPSGCHPLIQLTDYFCWAIYRKYASESGDLRSYKIIEGAIDDEWKMI